MNRLFAVVLLTLWLCACKKNPSYQGQVTYTLNGARVSFGNSQLISLEQTGSAGVSPILRLTAESSDFSSGFDLALFADTLMPGTVYSDMTIPAAHALSINNFYYKGSEMTAIDYAYTNFTVTITRYSNGSIDGTFTGRIAGALSNGDAIDDSVMNGSLTNVLVQ